MNTAGLTNAKLQNAACCADVQVETHSTIAGGVQTYFHLWYVLV
jgi:hypothetical protein